MTLKPNANTKSDSREAPSRSWVYTINNYNDEELLQVTLFTVRKHRVCREVGDSGTPHLQGAVTFSRAYRLSQLAKLVPRAHWERAKCVDAENYCTKGEVLINVGHNNQGSRTDLETIADEIESGKLMYEIAKAHPSQYIRYNSGLEKLKFILSKHCEVFEKMEVIVIWGPPGSGKSKLAREMDPKLYNVQEPAGARLWFDGYDNEETILFDDFYGSWMPYHKLLQLLDIYPMLLEIKGGQTRRRWNKVIITSNKPPEEWYNRDECDALLRRIKRTIFLGKPCLLDSA